MAYRVLADAVVLVHLGFILFVAVGALLAWRWPGMALAHLPALTWGIGTVTIGFPCPLTSLEKALERRAGGDVYDGGFVDQYVEDVVYPAEYSTILRSLAAAVVVIGYIGLWRRRAQGKHGTARLGPRSAQTEGHTSLKIGSPIVPRLVRSSCSRRGIRMLLLRRDRPRGPASGGRSIIASRFPH